MPKQEVIQRLRFFKQPVTLFWEDDAARLDRLKYVLKAGDFEKRKKDRDEGDDGEKIANVGGDEDGDLSWDGGSSSVDKDKDLKRMKANFDDLCEEDKILVFFKRLSNEWSGFCRKKVLPDDIRQALMLVVECCLRRDYLAGMDHYIKLAIGNAPWPIGCDLQSLLAEERVSVGGGSHANEDMLRLMAAPKES
ncbi:hypothetical protein MLD38_026427 [Melastoma candidum]|uniref:Uncharacterized protein n=1 Tax=Melastoma candidum TaxID=119954 RepID=A0ACB9P0E8_9MYRT|nr:hypothetical protein MLD38_026427 [Melastoma candidum]